MGVPNQSRSKTAAVQQQSDREMKEMKEEPREGRKEAKEPWTGFLYNRRSGEVLGRTCSSWGETELWGSGALELLQGGRRERNRASTRPRVRALAP